jgi:hypothetical protein
MKLTARLKNGREITGIFTVKEILLFDPSIVEIIETKTKKVIWSR